MYSSKINDIKKESLLKLNNGELLNVNLEALTQILYTDHRVRKEFGFFILIYLRR